MVYAANADASSPNPLIRAISPTNFFPVRRKSPGRAARTHVARGGSRPCGEVSGDVRAGCANSVSASSLWQRLLSGGADPIAATTRDRGAGHRSAKEDALPEAAQPRPEPPARHRRVCEAHLQMRQFDRCAHHRPTILFVAQNALLAPRWNCAAGLVEERGTDAQGDGPPPPHARREVKSLLRDLIRANARGSDRRSWATCAPVPRLQRARRELQAYSAGRRALDRRRTANLIVLCRLLGVTLTQVGAARPRPAWRWCRVHPQALPELWSSASALVTQRLAIIDSPIPAPRRSRLRQRPEPWCKGDLARSRASAR